MIPTDADSDSPGRIVGSLEAACSSEDGVTYSRCAPSTRNPAVTSFDVFDTVLMRKVGAPEALFLLLGRRLNRRGVMRCTPHTFALERREADTRAHDYYGCGTTLQHVYNELAHGLGLDAALARCLMEEEVALEHALTCPVPGIDGLLAEMRADGSGILFLSDMYLNAGTVQSLLDAHGIRQPNDTTLVSCDIGHSKKEGGAFAAAVERLGVSPGRVHHYGNAFHGDVRNARNAGLTATHLPEANLNRYETILEAHSFRTNGLSSVMAGASRLARLEARPSTSSEAAVSNVAAGVAGPVLASYVLWVLRRAEAQGLRRLYFLSRDGHILLGIARILASKLSIDIQLEYLYAGRYACLLPTLDIRATSLEDAMEYAYSVRSFLRVLGIDGAEAAEVLEDAGFDEQEADRLLGADKSGMLRTVYEHPRVKTLARRHAAERRRGLVRYLEQEGMVHDTAWGIVDVGWKGTILSYLESVLRHEGGTIPQAFFFARSGAAPAVLPPIEAYFGDRVRKAGYASKLYTRLIEAFCPPPHGVVEDYHLAADAEALPMLASWEGRDVDWDYTRLRDGILQFARQLLLDRDLVDPDANMRPAVQELLRAFTEEPGPEEAFVWGRYPFEPTVDSRRRLALASAFGWTAPLEMLVRGQVDNGSYWKPAALAMSRPLVRRGVDLAERMRSKALRLLRKTLTQKKWLVLW